MTIMVVVSCAGVNQMDTISENFCNNRRGTCQSLLNKFIRTSDNGVEHTGNSSNEMQWRSMTLPRKGPYLSYDIIKRDFKRL